MTPYNLPELIGGKELTELELDVLLGAANGETARQTAERIGYSFDYVRQLRKQAIAKLPARNLAHAVAIALSRAILNPDLIEPDDL